MSSSQSYLDLWATAKINDSWVAKAEMESTHNMKTGADNSNLGNTTKVYVEGSLGSVKSKIGKFGALSTDL